MHLQANFLSFFLSFLLCYFDSLPRVIFGFRTFERKTRYFFGRRSEFSQLTLLKHTSSHHGGENQVSFPITSCLSRFKRTLQFSVRRKAQWSKEDLTAINAVVDRLQIGSLSPENKMNAICLMFLQSEQDKVNIGEETESLRAQVKNLEATKQMQAQLVEAMKHQVDLTREEGKLRLHEETEKRMAVSDQFQSTVSELSSLVDTHMKHNGKLKQENEELRANLKEILGQYEAREKVIGTKCTEFDLQSKLYEAQLAKSKIERAELNADFTKERLEMHKAMLQLNQEKDEILSNSVSAKEQLEVYQKQYEELQQGMGSSSKNFDHFRQEMERLGKKLRSVERDTQEWKNKFDDSNDQVKKMNQLSLEREEELKSVKKKLSAMEKLNRALQKERSDLMANKKE